MSQRIVGLDIGLSSVEAVTIETSLRHFQLVDIREVELPFLPDDATEEERRGSLLHVLRELVEDGLLEADTYICSLPGDKVLTRILQMPFTDARQIDATIGFELESHLPYSLDEIVYDYQILEETEEGARIYAAAARTEDFEDLLNLLQAVGIDPKMVSFGGMAYLNVLQRLEGIGDEPVMIVDIGGVRTDICVISAGKVESIRTLRRGGEAVTRNIAAEMGLDLNGAEAVKRKEGLVVGEDVSSVVDERESRLAAAARKALAPIIRGIHQTLQARQCSPGERAPVKRVLLCGGSSRLRGVHDYMEAELGISVEPLTVAGLEFNQLDDPYDGEGVIGKGLGLGLSAAPGSVRNPINFRRGQYSYAGDFQFLRDKLAILLFLGIVLLGIVGAKTYLRFGMLEERQEEQIAQLREFSENVLGTPMEDFNGVLLALKEVPDEKDLQFFPAMTAQETLHAIGRIVYVVNQTPSNEVRALFGLDTPSSPGIPAPAGVQPPGPGQADPLPSALRAQDRDERLRRLREMRELREMGSDRTLKPTTGRLGMPSLPMPGTTGPSVTPSPLRPITSPAATRSRTGSGAAPPTVTRPGSGDAEKKEEGSEESETEEEELARCAQKENFLCVELQQVQIDEKLASIDIEANSVQAYEKLNEVLRNHPCFRNVQIGDQDTITAFRNPHRGWADVELSFELLCAWSEAPEKETE